MYDLVESCSQSTWNFVSTSCLSHLVCSPNCRWKPEGETHLHPKNFTEHPPELGDELWPSFRNDVNRKSVRTGSLPILWKEGTLMSGTRWVMLERPSCFSTMVAMVVGGLIPTPSASVVLSKGKTLHLLVGVRGESVHEWVNVWMSYEALWFVFWNSPASLQDLNDTIGQCSKQNK